MNNIFYRTSSFITGSFTYVFRLPSTTRTGEKDESIQTLRGLAIVLVVLGHMIGYDSSGGMRVADDSIFRYLYYSLEYVRLPLFTVISGWVYANKPVADHNSLRFVKGKFQRLIIPMFTVSTLLFLFRMIIPGTNTKPELEDLPRNLVLPYDVYWFLYSLFLIFLLISVVDTKSVLHSFKGWCLAFGCSFILLFISENFLDPLPNLFSFKGAMFLLPFFLLGVGIYRHGGMLLNDKVVFTLGCVFAGAVSIQQILWFGDFPLPERASLLGITVGLSAAILLFRLKLKNTFLTRIGSYAYGIFLFHVFFTGGTRIVLQKLGIYNQWIILLSGVICAILFSIALVLLIERSRLLRFCLLGTKRIEK